MGFSGLILCASWMMLSMPWQCLQQRRCQAASNSCANFPRSITLYEKMNYTLTDWLGGLSPAYQLKRNTVIAFGRRHIISSVPRYLIANAINKSINIPVVSTFPYTYNRAGNGVYQVPNKCVSVLLQLLWAAVLDGKVPVVVTSVLRRAAHS